MKTKKNRQPFIKRLKSVNDVREVEYFEEREISLVFKILGLWVSYPKTGIGITYDYGAAK